MKGGHTCTGKCAANTYNFRESKNGDCSGYAIESKKINCCCHVRVGDGIGMTAPPRGAPAAQGRGDRAIVMRVEKGDAKFTPQEVLLPQREAGGLQIDAGRRGARPASPPFRRAWQGAAPRGRAAHSTRPSASLPPSRESRERRGSSEEGAGKGSPRRGRIARVEGRYSSSEGGRLSSSSPSPPYALLRLLRGGDAVRRSWVSFKVQERSPAMMIGRDLQLAAASGAHQCCGVGRRSAARGRLALRPETAA